MRRRKPTGTFDDVANSMNRNGTTSTDPDTQAVANSGKEALIYFFHADWCPHCKKAKPILEKIKEKYTKNKINGVQVSFKFINGDKHEADIISFEKEHNVKIEGFPTIYLVKGEEVIEYDADPTEDTMTEFLHTTL